MFLIPGIVSLFLSQFWGQSEICWLLPRYICHYCTYCAVVLTVPIWLLLWFIGTIARYYCWLFSSFGNLHGNFGTMTSIHQGGDIQVSSISGASGSCLNWICSSAIGLFHLWVTTKGNRIRLCWRVSSKTLTSSLEEGFLYPVLKIFLGSLWHIEVALSTQIEKGICIWHAIVIHRLIWTI